MKRLRTLALAFAAATACGAVASARTAAPAGFLGRWLIAETHPAPWYDPKDPATAPFDDHLVGKTIVYQATRILGPRPLACSRPRYRLLEVPPEGLFQGGLTSPQTQAAALGFRGRQIHTLETGCAGWFDFHFVDGATALFALDNRVYTLRKQAR